MRKGAWIFLIIALLSLAGFLFHKHFTQIPKDPSQELVNAELRLASGSPKDSPSTGQVRLWRSGFYQFITDSIGIGITAYPLRLDFGSFLIPTDKGWNLFERPFYLEQPCMLQAMYNFRYEVNQKMRLRIRELTGRPQKYCIYLNTLAYHSLGIPVSRGDRLDLSSQRELYYLGYFKDGRLLEEQLIQDIKTNTVPIWIWIDAEVRFRAAEVPFVFKVDGGPVKERFTIDVKGAGLFDYAVKNQNLPALYVESGDVVKTALWLDKDDTVAMDSFYRGKVAFSFDGKTWIGGNPQSSTFIKAPVSGFLWVKALQRCVLNRLEVRRYTKWTVELQPNQSREIEVFAGDVIKTKCNRRYFVNGQLLERDLEYTHNIPADGHLVIKASVDPRPIAAWVVARRGI
jgi:hypothetical protein